jgi:hypothetical protein
MEINLIPKLYILTRHNFVVQIFFIWNHLRAQIIDTSII